MKRVEILARGDVQRVGYRDVVQRIGRNLGISGTVQNQEPYDVRIVAEGEEEALKEFVEALRIEDGPILVRELEVRWLEATGEFPYFKIIRGDWQEELGERFDVAVGLLHRSIVLGEENLIVSKENLAVSRIMLDKQDQMLDKQDQMLDKQDASISILQEIKADTSEIGAIREEVSATREEARRGRDEIISTLKSDRMEEKYERLSQEIAEIKAAIAEIRAKVS
ncbi:MAG: acylphosphatase [Methanothrix sp.]|uniref:acylphosphatase n=1 Tax=Methanothrix harundinacea TaxID=301375 RepID=A0A117LET7_9EURY|nr:MAG: Acylphosphatases-like protein [Methanothrix harundinacea]MCP1392165.1 acylphosphatase [Methanothrix harundinacea]MDD3566119.1 acylphosphatase [Methanothrix sp.]MDD5515758.1 acylphosphatase [Synergistales bacterium]MDI9398724.1 acylphosphatase [Euryarchaeota archaeon]